MEDGPPALTIKIAKLSNIFDNFTKYTWNTLYTTVQNYFNGFDNNLVRFAHKIKLNIQFWS